MELRLQKFIAQAGYCSRREAEVLIRRGDVLVNGNVAVIGTKIDPSKDHVKIYGQKIKSNFKPHVIVFHKDKGILTRQSHDPKNISGTLFQFLRKTLPDNLKAAGRLDRDAEGLVVLTNVGEIQKRLSSKKYPLERRYRVKIDGHMDVKKLSRIKNSKIQLEERKVHVLDCSITSSTQGKQWLELTTYEVTNRAPRKIMEHFGHPVDRLIREEIGPLNIKGLKKNTYRMLSLSEIKELEKTLGIQ